MAMEMQRKEVLWKARLAGNFMTCGWVKGDSVVNPRAGKRKTPMTEIGMSKRRAHLMRGEGGDGGCVWGGNWSSLRGVIIRGISPALEKFVCVCVYVCMYTHTRVSGALHNYPYHINTISTQQNFHLAKTTWFPLFLSEHLSVLRFPCWVSIAS